MEQMMQIGILLILACGAVLLVLGVSFVLMMLFMERVRILQERGDTKAAYRLAQKILQLARVTYIRKSPHGWLMPVLLLQTSQLAEASGDMDAALGWAKQVYEGDFDTNYRVMALQHQAIRLRKQSRNTEAELLEEEALELSRLAELAKESSLTESALTETARNTILVSRGRFREALKNLENKWGRTSEVHRIGISAQKAMILRVLGRYDEALSAQSDMEILYEGIVNRYPSARPINQALYKIHRSSTLGSQLIRVQLCLEAGKVGAASEIWDALPAEAADDSTEALRYATGAWLFAMRGNADVARRLIADITEKHDAVKQAAIQGLLGRALFALRDYDDAANHFQNALAGCAGKPVSEAEFRALLAACYAKQGKYDLARAEYEAVIAAGFEEAVFTQEARAQLARLKANDAIDTGQARCFK